MSDTPVLGNSNLVVGHASGVAGIRQAGTQPLHFISPQVALRKKREKLVAFLEEWFFDEDQIGDDAEELADRILEVLKNDGR